MKCLHGSDLNLNLAERGQLFYFAEVICFILQYYLQPFVFAFQFFARRIPLDRVTFVYCSFADISFPATNIFFSRNTERARPLNDCTVNCGSSRGCIADFPGHCVQSNAELIYGSYSAPLFACCTLSKSIPSYSTFTQKTKQLKPCSCAIARVRH